MISPEHAKFLVGNYAHPAIEITPRRRIKAMGFRRERIFRFHIGNCGYKPWAWPSSVDSGRYQTGISTCSLLKLILDTGASKVSQALSGKDWPGESAVLQ